MSNHNTPHCHSLKVTDVTDGEESVCGFVIKWKCIFNNALSTLRDFFWVKPSQLFRCGKIKGPQSSKWVWFLWIQLWFQDAEETASGVEWKCCWMSFVSSAVKTCTSTLDAPVWVITLSPFPSSWLVRYILYRWRGGGSFHCQNKTKGVSQNSQKLHFNASFLPSLQHICLQMNPKSGRGPGVNWDSTSVG